MLERKHLATAGISAILLCAGLGFKAGQELSDRAEGWISVRPCLWSLYVPKTTRFLLWNSNIVCQSSSCGPKADIGARNDVCTWGGQAPPRPSDADENGFQHFFLSLRNPGAFRTVAVLEINSNEVTELNPRRTLHPNQPWQSKFDYGFIPQLGDLTRAECDQLWSFSEPSCPGIRTYRLKAFNDPKNTEFFLDACFRFDHLQKYRVRSSAKSGILVLKSSNFG